MHSYSDLHEIYCRANNFKWVKILECGHLERGNYWNYAKVWNEFDEGCMTCRHDILEQNLYYRNCSTLRVVKAWVAIHF